MAEAESTANLPAKPTPKELELAYRAILAGDVLPEVGDPEAVSRAIMERIQAAETFEEAFQTQTLPGWQTLMGVPVLVRNVRLNRSTVKRQEGKLQPSVYAVVDVAILDGPQKGDVSTVQCGGRNVLMQLVKMLERDWLDHPVKLVSKDTGEGYDVLWLEAA